MGQLENPYYDLTSIRDISMFVGRSYILKRLYAAITNQQSISLEGPHKIGKSSILQYMQLPVVQQRLGYNLSQHLFVLLDLHNFYNKTRLDFFDFLNEQLLFQSQGRLGVPMPSKTGEDGFSIILDQIKKQGVHSVILMDAFDNVTRNKQFDPEFFSFLRGHATWGKVSYITASIASLYEVSHTDVKDSPFFNIFSSCKVGALTEEEAHELITVPASRIGCAFTPEEERLILKLAGRHPFFIQRVCSILFDEKYILGKSDIDYEQIKNRAYNELFHHFEHTWQFLGEHDKERLEELKLEVQLRVVRERRVPEFSESSLVRQYIQKERNITPAHITFEDVEDALEKMVYGVRLLGECNLSYLAFISTLSKQGVARPTPTEKGIAVREMLHGVFEQLRGSGVHSDIASDWRPYNALYYRYFREHLKNEDIAAKMGITSRQFFRERKEAIEKLRDILLEMEARIILSSEEDDV